MFKRMDRILIAIVDTASNGGFSSSGDADGGDVARRAFDQDTAGGNAHTGDSSDVNGGNVVNTSEDDGTITNDDSCEYTPFT